MISPVDPNASVIGLMFANDKDVKFFGIQGVDINHVANNLTHYLEKLHAGKNCISIRLTHYKNPAAILAQAKRLQNIKVTFIKVELI